MRSVQGSPFGFFMGGHLGILMGGAPRYAAFLSENQAFRGVFREKLSVIYSIKVFLPYI